MALFRCSGGNGGGIADVTGKITVSSGPFKLTKASEFEIDGSVYILMVLTLSSSAKGTFACSLSDVMGSRLKYERYACMAPVSERYSTFMWWTESTKAFAITPQYETTMSAGNYYVVLQFSKL